MKRTTALHHIDTIIARLRAVNGFVSTPTANHPGIKVRRAWLFGSTLKGKDRPNDVDILIEWVPTGEHQWTNEKPFRGKRQNARKGRRLLGLCLSVSCFDDAIRWLRRGMKKISIHDYDIDCQVAQPRVLIWPIDRRVRPTAADSTLSGKHNDRQQHHRATPQGLVLGEISG